jgi:hypothetical protein
MSPVHSEKAAVNYRNITITTLKKRKILHGSRLACYLIGALLGTCVEYLNGVVVERTRFRTTSGAFSIGKQNKVVQCSYC